MFINPFTPVVVVYIYICMYYYIYILYLFIFIYIYIKYTQAIPLVSYWICHWGWPSHWLFQGLKSTSTCSRFGPAPQWSTMGGFRDHRVDLNQNLPSILPWIVYNLWSIKSDDFSIDLTKDYVQWGLNQRSFCTGTWVKKQPKPTKMRYSQKNMW